MTEIVDDSTTISQPSMPNLGNDVFPFDTDAETNVLSNVLPCVLLPSIIKVGLNANNTLSSNVVPSNLNPLATSYTYCGDDCHPNLISPNSRFVIHSDNVGILATSNLNPLATKFISGQNVDPDSQDLIRVYNTNAVGGGDELFIAIFMAFILILSSYIVNAISINTYVPMNSGWVSNTNPEDAMNILREIRITNVNRVIIGTLNINSLPQKFEQLKLIIDNYLDVLVIQETKLDPSF